METILTVNQISKKYGRHSVLEDVSLSIPKGSIYGLIGKNGAGKTTLMRIISGLQEPSEGSIERGKIRIGALINTPAFYGNLSAYQNLKAEFIALGLTSFERIPELLKLVNLADTGKKRAKNFSLGMKQRLGIAIAMAGEPDVMLLDEPINGLDPQGIVEMREVFLKINQEKGTTLIISSHLLDELSKIATDYAFIDKGKIIKEISSQDILLGSEHSYTATLTDVNKILKALDNEGIRYKVLSDSEIRIESEITLSELAKIAENNQVKLLEFTENDTSLEGYYINLVEG